MEIDKVGFTNQFPYSQYVISSDALLATESAVKGGWRDAVIIRESDFWANRRNVQASEGGKRCSNRSVADDTRSRLTRSRPIFHAQLCQCDPPTVVIFEEGDRRSSFAVRPATFNAPLGNEHVR